MRNIDEEMERNAEKQRVDDADIFDRAAKIAGESYQPMLWQQPRILPPDYDPEKEQLGKDLYEYKSLLKAVINAIPASMSSDLADLRSQLDKCRRERDRNDRLAESMARKNQQLENEIKEIRSTLRSLIRRD